MHRAGHRAKHQAGHVAGHGVEHGVRHDVWIVLDMGLGMKLTMRKGIVIGVKVGIQLGMLGIGAHGNEFASAFDKKTEKASFLTLFGRVNLKVFQGPRFCYRDPPLQS